MVEGDSMLVIQVVQGAWDTPWHLKLIADDIRWLASKFHCIRWNHIFREANFVTGTLDHFGHTVANPYFLEYCLPFSSMEVFKFDCMGNNSIRGFKF